MRLLGEPGESNNLTTSQHITLFLGLAGLEGQTMAHKPVANLRQELAKGKRDFTGNSLTKPTVWHFTTGIDSYLSCQDFLL
jgi:uncharacterized protein YvpB